MMPTPSVLITGAAGDIGSAIAKHLVASGQPVVLADHPSAQSRLEAVAAVLKEVDRAVDVRILTFDVTNSDSVSAAFESLVIADALPTFICNNAGVQGPFGRIDAVSYADMRTVFDVNVMGAIMVIGEWSRHMIAAGAPGACVNTASMAGVSGAPNMAAYSASKAAIIAMTKSVAKDLAPFGIRVNAISPAFIGPGAMWDRQVELQAGANSQYFSTDPETVSQQMIGMIPLRRYGSLGEVASVVAFLLSDAASYLTGNNIEIAGGSA
jgi:NAD(P)-dependent dehydrogenase (short-subunit alcohol dehydrogenase family)